MSIWTQNLFDFKIVRILIILGLVAFGIIFYLDYNSLESRCERKVDNLSSLLPDKFISQMPKAQIEAAKKPSIQECISKNEID